MCMIIEITGNGMTASEARRIAALSTLLGSDDDPPVLSIHGCDLLSEDADWDADTWDMSAEGKAVLRDALTLVMTEVPGPLDLAALWYEGPDAPNVPVEAVNRDELLELVASGCISTHSGYRVAPSGGIPADGDRKSR